MTGILITISNALPLLFKGALMTVKLWVVAGSISLIMGGVWGILRARQMRVFFLSYFFDALTGLLRGVPFYVQLLIAYFVVPDLLGGVFISPFVASTISLGFCSAAYTSQIVKSGFDAIPLGEWEAAYVLGYSLRQALWNLMLPRAFLLIKPALCGEFDQLLKSTSVVSTLGLMELTHAARNIVERDLQPLPIYAAVALIYLSMSLLFNLVVMRYIGRRYADD